LSNVRAIETSLGMFCCKEQACGLFHKKKKKRKLKKCFFSLKHSVLVGLVALTKSLVYLYLNISALPVPFGKWVWCVGSVLRLLMHNL